MSWLDALGWAGSALLVYSLLQARVLRFRVLNFVASVLLTVFNAILGIVPMIALNGVLAVINLWFIVRLTRQRHDVAAYEVLEVSQDDAYLRHVLRLHESDIRSFFPDVDLDPDVPGRSVFLIVCGDETVGVVMVRDAGDGVAQVELDWYAGIKPTWGPLTFDFGVIYYSYPGANPNNSIPVPTNDPNYVELKAGYSWSALHPSLVTGTTVFWSPDYVFETGSVWTIETMAAITISRLMASAKKAAFERSNACPNPPRSRTWTVTERPLPGLVTRSQVPNGYWFDAVVVGSFSSKI